MYRLYSIVYVFRVHHTALIKRICVTWCDLACPIVSEQLPDVDFLWIHPVQPFTTWPMLFGDLYEELAKNVTSFPTLTLRQLLLFSTLATKLTAEILLAQTSTQSPEVAPLFLPSAIVGFLADACGIDGETITQCWTLLKEFIWQDDDSAITGVSEVGFCVKVQTF